ncbi:MAG TPA: tRNA (N(6)-L-threonylcarbamoyladenosine(37)-C(2))-methylthiotransferase MtaB [Bacillota bacterium]|nr:tRNA (N(6)-L-threonylcarbamoyladenosine(37)-C(2))-methylthiotransferase MtaB [Bacillota bacterium]
MTTKLTAAIYTLGCRVNQYESEAIAAHLRSRGIDATAAESLGAVCDIYIVNTCAVTAESSAKSRKLLRRLRRINPRAVIAAVGCDGQLEPEVLTGSGADIVAGSRKKLEAAERAAELAEKRREGAVPAEPIIDVAPADSLTPEPMRIEGFGRTRAFIKIQDGCDGNCSYCIIPKLRGRVTSRPQGEIVEEAKAIAASGCREIVLTGIETAAYEHDLPGLIARIAEIEGIERIRLSSLDPAFLKPAVVDRLAGIKKLMPHYHLSLQSGSSRVLAAMRRKYNAEQAMRNIEYLRQAVPGVKFTADILTCFPGETDEEFKETVEFARRAEFYHMHVFTYSPRPGTDAASLPELPPKVRAERSKRLLELDEELRLLHHRRAVETGEPVEILFEQRSGEHITGHTRDFMEAAVKAGDADAEKLRGEIRLARPVFAGEKHLVCELV